TDTAARAQGAPKPLPTAALSTAGVHDDFLVLDEIRARQEQRIAREVASGVRPVEAASASELDFACVRAGLLAGISDASITAWLRLQRPEKPRLYAQKTLERAQTWPSEELY